MEDEGDIIATAFYSSPNSLSNVPTSRGDPTSLIIFNIFHAQVKLLPASTSPLLSMYNHYFFYMFFLYVTQSSSCWFSACVFVHSSQSDILIDLRKDSTLVTMCCHALRVASPCWNIICISFQMPETWVLVQMCNYCVITLFSQCIVGYFSSNMSSCSDVYYCMIPLFNQCIVRYFSSLVVLSTKKAGWHKYCSWKYVLGGCQISIAFPDEGTWKCFFHKQLQYFPMVRHSF